MLNEAELKELITKAKEAEDLLDEEEKQKRIDHIASARKALDKMVDAHHTEMNKENK